MPIRLTNFLPNVFRNAKDAVIPGFYGGMEDGTVKTFSRGGSDVTGSLVAKAIHADIYENWNRCFRIPGNRSENR